MIKFGWAERDITPDKKLSLAGQFAERISEYVEKPLTVTALVADDGKEQMILVSTDLVGVYWTLLQSVRERIAKINPEIDPMKIVISAIHTHTGPVLPAQGRLHNVGDGTLDPLQVTVKQFLAEGQHYVEKQNTCRYGLPA